MTTQPAEPVQAYAWPPLPVTDPDAAAEIMAERLAAAWSDLEDERLRVVESAAMGRKDLVDVFLREFQAAILAFVSTVELDVAEFIRKHIGPRYEEAVQQALGGPMIWTQPHRQALTSLASDTYADFLARAREAERVSESFVRAVRAASASELPKIAAGGRTAIQAADRLEERLLTRYGIDHVTYRNGAEVPVRTYARMAARTKSAVAYNAGALNAAVEAGVAYVEVMDGPECGWRSHDDPDMAARSIRPVAEAGRYAIAHPNCRRAFGPRPDVTTAAEAAAAEPMVSEAQMIDQLETDQLNRQRARRPRAAAARRARTTARRQARLLGVDSTDQVEGIVRAIRADAGIDVDEEPTRRTPEDLAAEAVALSRDDYYRMADELVESLDPADRNAVDRYVGQAYSRVNTALRQGDPMGEEDQDIADRLGRIVGDAQLPATTWAYRGVDNASAVFGDGDLTGRTLTDRAFLSMTTDAGLARSFRSSKRGATLEILVPGGSRVAAVNTRELELLAQAGSRLRVVRDYRDDDDHRHILATLEQP